MNPVDRWQKLYQKVDRDKHTRDDAEGRTREEDEAKAAQEAWCAGVTSQVMEHLHGQICERAEQFRKETGNTIVVTYPSEAPNAHVAVAAHEMRFVRLALDDARIYLYSARSPMKLPALHLLSTVEQLRPAAAKRSRPSTHPGRPPTGSGRSSTGSGRPSTYPGRSSVAPPARKSSSMNIAADRVVSRSVGRVVKTAEGGYELQERTAQGSGKTLEMDGVVFRAFEMLVSMWHRTQK